MGKTTMILWKKYQKENIAIIYKRVLKEGWGIKLKNVTPNGIFTFELEGYEPARDWHGGWQLHELTSPKRRTIQLGTIPEEGEWIIA
jgi:hypothetical protein